MILTSTFEYFVALRKGRLPALLPVPAAYVLSRWRFRRQRTATSWILANRTMPPVASIIPFYLTFFAATAMMLPVAVFTILVSRRLVHGLTAGGMKD